MTDLFLNAYNLMKETLLTQIDKWTSLDFIIFIMNIRGSSLRKLLLLQMFFI